MVTGLNHLTISVKELDASFHFYSDILGFKKLMKSPQNAYLLAGTLWLCLEVDANINAFKLPGYTHFAFAVKPEQYPDITQKIQSYGSKIWKENSSEGDSLYFLDPNGYQLEIHVGGWESRLEHYKREGKFRDMVFYDK